MSDDRCTKGRSCHIAGRGTIVEGKMATYSRNEGVGGDVHMYAEGSESL